MDSHNKRERLRHIFFQIIKECFYFLRCTCYCWKQFYFKKVNNFEICSVKCIENNFLMLPLIETVLKRCHRMDKFNNPAIETHEPEGRDIWRTTLESLGGKKRIFKDIK